MRISLVLVAGIVFGLVLGHLNFSAAAQGQSPAGQFQMILPTSNTGPFGYLLNVETGALSWCGLQNGTNGTVACSAVTFR